MLLLPIALAIYNFHAFAEVIPPASFWSFAMNGGVREEGPAVSWLVVLGMLLLLRRASGRTHPPFDEGELSPGRRVVGIVTLLLFVVLFMPTPMRVLGN